MTSRKRYAAVFVLLSLILVMLVLINIMTGSVKLTPAQVTEVIFGGGSDAMNRNIVMEIRLPRVLSAVILGGALALSGYLLQTFFANPVVGPFVLGISSGAKLAVALCMIVLISSGHAATSLLMVGAAFLGALLAMGFVLLISLKVRSVGILVVCGIMIGYICSAVTDLIVTFADDSDIVNLHNWSMGSLSGMSWNEVRIMFFITLICFGWAVMISNPIGAYRLGEDYAKSLGVNIRTLRIMLILIASLLAASATAFAGPISFVGIAVPHLSKNVLKTTSPLVMIPACFLVGGGVTLFCDGIARTILAPAEVSISSVTAVLLAPVVIAIMIKRRLR